MLYYVESQSLLLINYSTSLTSHLCISIYMYLLTFQGVGGGILRGMGRQQLGAAIIAITYSVGLAGGIPIMLFTDLGIMGLYSPPVFFFNTHASFFF